MVSANTLTKNEQGGGPLESAQNVKTKKWEGSVSSKRRCRTCSSSLPTTDWLYPVTVLKIEEAAPGGRVG
jgi:hypothetical protein